jgi:hypothetical protein
MKTQDRVLWVRLIYEHAIRHHAFGTARKWYRLSKRAGRQPIKFLLNWSNLPPEIESLQVYQTGLIICAAVGFFEVNEKPGGIDRFMQRRGNKIARLLAGGGEAVFNLSKFDPPSVSTLEASFRRQIHAIDDYRKYLKQWFAVAFRDVFAANLRYHSLNSVISGLRQSAASVEREKPKIRIRELQRGLDVWDLRKSGDSWADVVERLGDREQRRQKKESSTQKTFMNHLKRAKGLSENFMRCGEFVTPGI